MWRIPSCLELPGPSLLPSPWLWEAFLNTCQQVSRVRDFEHQDPWDLYCFHLLVKDSRQKGRKAFPGGRLGGFLGGKMGGFLGGDLADILGGPSAPGCGKAASSSMRMAQCYGLSCPLSMAYMTRSGVSWDAAQPALMAHQACQNLSEV